MTILHEPAVDCGFHSTDAKAEAMAAPAPAPAAHPLDAEEPILKANPGRFVIFPIQHHETWEWYKKSQASIWTAEEIDLAHDMADWEKLNDDEQFFVKNVLAFFAGADGIVVRTAPSNTHLGRGLSPLATVSNRTRTSSSASRKRCRSPRPSSSTAFRS